MDRYEILEVNLDKTEYICFDLFEVCFLNFFSKKEAMKNTNNRNVSELAHCIRFFQMQEIGTYFVNTKILVWSLFSWGPLKSAFFLYLFFITNWHSEENSLFEALSGFLASSCR